MSSWASIVKKDVDVNTPAPVKQVLMVQLSKVQEQPSRKGNSSTEVQLRILPLSGLPEGTRAVVLDTGAFLRAHNIASLGNKFYTIQDVINEVRDAKNREALENITFELEVVSPTDEALRAVLQLTTKTGDIGALSRTDLRVLAVAYQIAKEAGTLRTVQEHISGGEEKEDEIGDENEKDDEDEVVEEEGEGDAQQDTTTMNNTSDDDVDDDIDDDDGWITAENVHVFKAQAQEVTVAQQVTQSPVSCLTIDFSMQNALLHLGVPVLGVDGRNITRMRTWILRCHACFTLVQDTSKQFCPACGSGNTLRKVSYTIDEDGNRHVWINWRRRLNTRGIRYNIPRPRWGAHGTNRTLVLREDQLKGFGQPKSQRQILQEREKSLKESDPVLFGKKHKKGSHAPHEKSSYHRFNVNERRQVRASRKK